MDSGYHVVSTDHWHPARQSGRLHGRVPTDLGQVIELLSGVGEGQAADAIVHLSAIPASGMATKRPSDHARFRSWQDDTPARR